MDVVAGADGATPGISSAGSHRPSCTRDATAERGQVLSGVVVLPSGPASVDAETLATLTLACRDRDRFRFRYRRRDGETARRDVEPHRLVSAGRRWYLLG